MRPANVPTLATTVLGCAFVLCVLSCARAAADSVGEDAALGFEGAFGAAAPALGGPSSALLVNPAALAAARQRALWSGGALYRGGESLHLGALYPSASAFVFGAGFTRARVSDVSGGLEARRHRVHLGTAWRATSAWSLGANVQLLDQENDAHGDTSFGVDLGARWSWNPTAGRSGHPVLAAGLMVRNALEPRLGLGDEVTYESRTWTAGLAWTAWRRGRWSTTLASGVEAPRDARRSLSYLASAQAPGGVSIGLGVHDTRLRVGVGVSSRAWTLGYAFADARDGATHGLDMRVRFGADLVGRHAQSQRANELEFASRLVALAEQGTAAQRLRWRHAANEALARREFEHAATLYRMVLETLPGDARAADGLAQAQHGALLRHADAMLQEHDRAGAARALEQAIALVPADSVSAQRLRELQVAVRDASRTRSEVSRHFKAGIDAYARQDYRAAIESFDAVLQLDAQHVAAASYLEQARNAHEVRVRSALKQARTRLEAGDFEAARSHLRRLAEMDPGNAQAQRLSARIARSAQAARLEAERQRQAQQEGQVAVVSGEDSAPSVPSAEVRARYDSGMQQYRSGDLMGAMQTWEEVAKLAPHFDEVDKNLLRVYRVTGLESYTEGRLRDAVDIWEKALRLEPDNTQLRRYLNRAYAKLHRAQSVDPRR